MGYKVKTYFRDVTSPPETHPVPAHGEYKERAVAANILIFDILPYKLLHHFFNDIYFFVNYTTHPARQSTFPDKLGANSQGFAFNSLFLFCLGANVEFFRDRSTQKHYFRGLSQYNFYNRVNYFCTKIECGGVVKLIWQFLCVILRAHYVSTSA